MKVAIHPNRHMVNAGEEACISTHAYPRKKGTRTYYNGTVILRDVEFVVHKSGVERAQKEKQRNVHAWAVGDIDSEFPGQVPIPKKMLKMMRKVTYHYEEGYFRDFYTNKRVEKTKVLYAVGRDFYYLPEK